MKYPAKPTKKAVIAVPISPKMMGPVAKINNAITLKRSIVIPTVSFVKILFLSGDLSSPRPNPFTL